MEDDDDDIPTLTAIRIYEGRVSTEAPGIEPTDTVSTSPLGGVEVTIFLEWAGGSGSHRIAVQIGTDDQHGGTVNVDKTHQAVFHIASQRASQVTAERPVTYPIYFWWDDIPAGQRFLTVRRRT